MNHDHDTLLVRELRTTLHGLADAHDPAPLARDLWSRGRAQRPRTARLDLVAAAVVLIALLASTVLLTRPGQLLQPAEAPAGGALPTDVWLPKLDQLIARDQLSLSGLDEVGPVSIATMLTQDTALLVSAKTGEHHLVELETRGIGRRLPWLALSPDGTQLAHPFRDIGSSRSDTTAGIEIVDLVDGSSVTADLSNSGGAPIAAETIRFSPNGEWLGWNGVTFQPDEGLVDEAPWAGVMSVRADRTREWQLPQGGYSDFSAVSASSVAVDDNGTLALATTSRLWQVAASTPSGPLQRQDGLRLPKGVHPAHGLGALNGPGTVWSVPVGGDGLSSRDVQLSSDALIPGARRAWIPAGDAATSTMTVVGRSPDGALVALDDRVIPRVQRAQDGEPARVLTTVHNEAKEDYDRGQYAVAFGLGDAEPVSSATPSWAPSRRPWIIAGLGASLVLITVLLVLLHRHRTRLSSTADADTTLGQAPKQWRPTRATGWAIAIGIFLVIVALLS